MIFLYHASNFSCSQNSFIKEADSLSVEIKKIDVKNGEGAKINYMIYILHWNPISKALA